MKGTYLLYPSLFWILFKQFLPVAIDYTLTFHIDHTY